MKEKINQLTTALRGLKTKITNFKQEQQTALNQAQNQVNERSQLLEQANHKLELSFKENEAVLERLLKEFKELEESIS